MSSNPFAAYLETKVLSASPVQLVHLAYEGAIEALSDARSHLAGKRIQERVRAITKVQLILTELQNSLDFNQGGDVSIQLGRLYDYMQRRLTEANFKQIEEPLSEVQGLLQTLDEAWKEIAAKGTPSPAAVPEPAPAPTSGFGYSESQTYSSSSSYANSSSYADTVGYGRPDNPIYGRAESSYRYAETF
jgi:flagellar secretion chaperone FliS